MTRKRLLELYDNYINFIGDDQEFLDLVYYVYGSKKLKIITYKNCKVIEYDTNKHFGKSCLWKNYTCKNNTYKNNIEKESIQKIKEWLRCSINPLIKEKRNLFVCGDLCNICGKPILDKNDLHIDHDVVSFKEIYDKFTQNISIDQLIKFRNKYRGCEGNLPPKLQSIFINFHNNTGTKLVFTHSKCNLKK